MNVVLTERDQPAITPMQTYGRLVQQHGKYGHIRWALSGVPPHVRIRLKQLFGGIHKAETDTFYFSNADGLCADLWWFMVRYPMEMDAADRTAISEAKQRFEQNRLRNEAILLPDWKAPEKYGFRAGEEAYLPQKQAAEMLLRLGRLLVMDDVGLGKTITALYALAGSQYLPAAIVVQPHLPSQWVGFIKRFTHMSVHVVKGRKPYLLPPANLYIFTYSNIGWWADVASTGIFKAVIFDEIQELRQGTATLKGRAAKVFVDHAKLKAGLSASPIFNYGSEIFHIVEYLHPGILGSWDEFCREWCTFDGKRYLVDDPEALGTYLREQHLVIRRERQGRKINKVLIELPWDSMAVDADDKLSRDLAIKVLTGSFHESGLAARELDMRMRMHTGIAKARGVAAYTRMLLEAKIPVVVFCWHREVYRILNRELAAYKPLMYTGTEISGKKDKNKEAFLRGESDIILMSLRAGQGVDGIQARCNTVLFAEWDWSPKIHDPQCIGRLDRPGQPEDEITAISFWTNGGSDPLVMSVHGVKGSQARGIIDPLKGTEAVFSDGSRVKELARRYLGQQGVQLEA